MNEPYFLLPGLGAVVRMAAIAQIFQRKFASNPVCLAQHFYIKYYITTSFLITYSLYVQCPPPPLKLRLRVVVVNIITVYIYFVRKITTDNILKLRDLGF